MEFERQKFANKSERSNFYWKDGLKHEVHRWLRQNIGPRVQTLSLWDTSTEGEWIFLGSQIRQKSHKRTITLRFRNKAQAMLFKLTWAGRL